jgi:hypothetical protein
MDGSKAGLFRHGQPTAHLVRFREKMFAAFLRQIAPIGPVLPTYPANKSFAVNKMPAQCYLDTIEASVNTKTAKARPAKDPARKKAV